MRVSDVRIVERSLDCLDAYADIPIAFTVTSRLCVPVVDGPDEFGLHEEAVTPPYTKDYDAITEAHPLGWRRFDLSHWGFFDAVTNDVRVGSIAIAWNPGGAEPLEGLADLAIAWDIRVAPKARGSGVGGALLRQAEQWARDHGCRSMMMETQHINVPACRFYGRHGYRLDQVDPHAYPDLPDEVQMLWRKDLSTPPS